MSSIQRIRTQYTQFEYECTVTNPDVFVDDLVSRQLAPLKRALSFFVKQKHATASPVTADIGSYASGIMTRDHTSKWAHDDRRAVFVKPVWLPLSTGSLTGRFDGATVSYQYGRSASLYDLYYLDRKTPGWNELCPPCRIETLEAGSSDKVGVDESPECKACVNFCDPLRLIARNGWKLNAMPRGPQNRADCWWTPGKDGSTLELPAAVAPSGATHCHFSASVDGQLGADEQLVFERQNVATGAWEVVHSRHSGGNVSIPWVTTRGANDRTVTFAFEASQVLTPGKVPAFRLRAVGTSMAGDTKVFDPVVYCRMGKLP